MIGTEDILSSTGTLGTSVRPDQRLYHNAEVFYDDPSDVVDMFEDNVRLASGMNQGLSEESQISRVVFRSLVSRQVLDTILSSDLQSDLEIAMPAEEFSQSGWLIYLARNHPDRRPLNPTEDMVSATSDSTRRAERSANHREGLEVTLKTSLNEIDQTQLLDLWGPTFGWTEEELGQLATRVEDELSDPGSDRSVWFSSLVSGDTLVSAAMAERLTLMGRDGPLDIVENTEWRTRSEGEYANKGLMTRNLMALNSQVLRSFIDSGLEAPLIFAECNFASRSDRAGYKAGFRIPDRDYAAQLAIQNVTINDEVLPKGLRDFTFMYLPVAAHSIET